MNGDQQILPLIDRRAPVLERIRSDSNNNSKLSSMLARAIGEVVKSDDEDEIEDTKEQLAENLTSSLANELGVSDDDIDQGYVEEVVNTIGDADEETVLTDDALESLGIRSDADDEEDEEEERDASLFD